jgi:CubicO group peptidase (beta-lactamase class C family)
MALGRQDANETVGERLAADLKWTQAERDQRFAHMDRLFPVHIVRRGGRIRPLPKGARLAFDDKEIALYMQAEHLAGILVLQRGRVRAEQYALSLKPATRWTSFSVTKAVTDTLAGAALHIGTLHSLDDGVTRYLPEMRGSAYEGVTVRQLMTMTSGVQWNENYTSPDADNVRLYTTPVVPGHNATVEYMRTLPRASAPGSRWVYNTGETDLLGVLLHRATGESLSEQLSQAIWQRAGMEHDATWIASASGKKGEEFGGSGLSATLRDFGRFGQWVLEGGHGAVAPRWFAEATRAQVRAGNAAYGYGWWPQGGNMADGSFAALGIFGESILIDPKRQLVIVTLGDWDSATSAAHSAARAAFWRQVKTAVDAESPR